MDFGHSEKPVEKKGTVIVLRMTAEDAERAMQAFRDGKLTELGITEMDIAPESESQGKWTQAEKTSPSSAIAHTPRLP